MELIAIAAISLDGFITAGDQSGSSFTSEADKQWFAAVLKTFPVKVMGRKTFDVSKSRILESVKHSTGDLRVVLTRTPENHRHAEIPGRLRFSNQKPADLVAWGRNQGFPRLAILGGSPIYSAFLNAGLIHEFWITLEPRLFGFGTPLLQPESQANLQLMASSQLGPSTLLLKYTVEKALE